MNKVLNWTFGSIFRTLGRLIVYFGIGALIFSILAKNDFNIIDFIMPINVKADEVEYTFNTNQSNICVDNHGTQLCGGYKDNPYDDNLNYPLELIKYRVKLNDGWLKDNVYTINVGYKPTPDAIHVSSLSVCWENSGDCETYTSQKGWNKNSSGYYRNIISFSPTVDHSSNEYLYIYVQFIPGYLTTIRPSLLNTLSVARGTDAIIKDQTNQIIDSQNQTNEKLDNIEDTLTDTSDIDISSLENVAGWLPPGPVDSILNLPLTMFNSLLTKLNSSACSPVSLTLPFVNTTYELPCINSLYDKIGITGTLFNTTGLIASAFILFNYLLALYKWIDDTLSLRENTMPGYFDDNWGGGA